jgi:hypothetical protein
MYEHRGLIYKGPGLIYKLRRADVQLPKDRVQNDVQLITRANLRVQNDVQL